MEEPTMEQLRQTLLETPMDTEWMVMVDAEAAPGCVLMLEEPATIYRMTPAAARQMAALLLANADAAEEEESHETGGRLASDA